MSTRNCIGLTHYHYGSGSTSNYAAMEIWGVGNIQRWYYGDMRTWFGGRVDGTGFYHNSVGSNDYVLLAGGGYKLTSEIQAVPNKRWAATIQGSNWSRLYVGNQSTLHHSSIFSIEGSVGCVVFSGTYLVQSNHPTCAHITQLTGGNYT